MQLSKDLSSIINNQLQLKPSGFLSVQNNDSD